MLGKLFARDCGMEEETCVTINQAYLESIVLVHRGPLLSQFVASARMTILALKCIVVNCSVLLCTAEYGLQHAIKL